MKNIKKILAFISLFTMIFMFTGVVSAANYTGSPGNSIQASINETNNDTIVVNDNSTSTYKNIEINKPQLESNRGNITFHDLNPSNSATNTTPSENHPKHEIVYTASGFNTNKLIYEAGEKTLLGVGAGAIIAGAVIANPPLIIGGFTAVGSGLIAHANNPHKNEGWWS